MTADERAAAIQVIVLSRQLQTHRAALKSLTTLVASLEARLPVAIEHLRKMTTTPSHPVED
jgi:hypothetical protein